MNNIDTNEKELNKREQTADEIELTEQELETILAGYQCICPPPVNRPF